MDHRGWSSSPGYVDAPCLGRNPGYWDYWLKQAESDRLARGILTRWDFNEALFEYLNTSLNDALASTQVVVRALAMLDRRLDRRRFEKLQVPPDEHPLVREFYELRGEAEEWATITPEGEA